MIEAHDSVSAASGYPLRQLHLIQSLALRMVARGVLGGFDTGGSTSTQPCLLARYPIPSSSGRTLRTSPVRGCPMNHYTRRMAGWAEGMGHTTRSCALPLAV